MRNEASASWKSSQEFEQVKEWGRSQLLTAIDLLAAWYEEREALYLELFAGWVHSRIAADLSEEEVPKDYKPGKAIELTSQAWIEILRSQALAEAIQIFTADLHQVSSSLSMPVLKRLRVLFIGDCLQFEVMTALIGPCSQAQIAIEPHLINERVQPILRNQIRKCSPDDFDLVFFSPFSHNYLPEYDGMSKPGRHLWPASGTEVGIEVMLKEVRTTLDALAAHFDCPVYVHNTAGTMQSFGSAAGLATNLMSRRGRQRKRPIINAGIASYLADTPAGSRLQLLDEDALRRKWSESELGRVYLNSYAFHPTRLGVELGRGPYFDAAYVAAFLATRKVVVCDLDNTLWDGLIGEGPVTQYLERQTTLKELRQRGILLSIISKNDPRNIHWSDGVLEANDFVAARINWNSKADNMASIRNELNLDPKNFVFIDDRPDELERMRNAFPGILALDATSPSTWHHLACWQKTLPPAHGEDRTALYHERANRQQFLKEAAQSVAAFEDETAALVALGLYVELREAGRADLPRAAELINRTNQFNLAGNRTTLRELEDGLCTRHSIITAEAGDKFGHMGIVGVMRVDYESNAIEISSFVLSCRAFGFGIEYALLNAVKGLVRDDEVIVAHYAETQFNQPCREFYARSGMTWNGDRWVGRVGDLAPDPAWLRIENMVSEKRLAVKRHTAILRRFLPTCGVIESGRQSVKLEAMHWGERVGSDAPRVTHIVPALFGTDGVVGGAERYAFELARHMAQTTPTRLVTFGSADSSCSVDGLEVRVIGSPRYVRGQRNNPISGALLAELRTADIVHCHQQHIVASSLAALFCRSTGRRVFVTDLGGGGWDVSTYISTDLWYHGHLHISEYSRICSGHSDARNAYVVLGGVDTEKFAPDPGVHRQGVVAFVGRILPHKGIDDLIKALPTGLTLEIIGQAYSSEYLEVLKTLALGKRVVFRHDCDDAMLVDVYRRALCVVLPSVYRSYDGRETRVPELLGQTLLEGMACATPVICTSVGAMPEVVLDGDTGFVTPPNDPAALSERISWLAEHREAGVAMGARARRRVLDRFTWPKVVGRCLEAYNA